MSPLRLRELASRNRLSNRLKSLIRTSPSVDESFLERLEEILIEADAGVKVSSTLLEGLRRKPATGDILDCLGEQMSNIFSGRSREMVADSAGPTVVLVVGVNGVGKTTTVGKLASLFRKKGQKVLLAASDTFRAAAIEQLEIWAKRAGAGVVKHSYGASASAVVFDAVEASVARGMDILIIDTAGRLHTKVNLMEELKKMKVVCGKKLPGAPHEILLVLDATTGQNALTQARLFHEALGITGVVLVKMDGTAKGGCVLAVEDELGIPVKLVGTGEGLEDLESFNPDEFVQALLTPS